GIGIAVGVALVFAVQIANNSITSGSSEIVRSLVGSADLQLRARSASGFDERLLDRARALPGVQLATPVLDLTATVRGPNGHQLTVQLVSADVSIAALAGLRDTALERLQPPAVLLPSAAAHALGVSTRLDAGIPAALPTISLGVRGHAVPVRVSAVLGPETAGTLSSAMAVIAPLRSVQAMANLPGRITGVLVESKHRAREQVRRELEVLAAGRLTVAPSTDDVRLLRQATVPNGKATGFFAFVSALVGILLAFNAMLLSSPERRRVIADLRIQGTRPRDLVKLLLFQALCLGLAASVVGVLVGDLLSRRVFHQTPGYLASAFPLGTQTVIGWQPVALSILGGIAATCMAAAPPLLDLRRSRAVDAVYYEEGEPGHAISKRASGWLFVASLALIAASTIAMRAFGPSAAVGAIVGLALAAVLAIPLSFTIVVWIAQRIAAATSHLNMLLIATRALRATTARSLALAATGAVAVFGSVAAEGAHRDLLNGLYGSYAQYVSTSSLWLTNARDDLATNSFPVGDLPGRISRLTGVAAVRPYQGGFLDLAGRRAWIIARSPKARRMFPQGQVLAGDSRLADARLRAGGWITASRQIAHAAGVGVAGMLTVPTPTGPVDYRLAATTTNLGWAGGALVLNDSDYRRAWASADPSALEIDARPGANPATVKRQVEGLLAVGGGLSVQTSAARAAQADALAREGLSRLTQIALLLMIAAALAMAAAMGASIWQRRPSLASLRIQSFRPSQLRVILLCESALVLATGSLVGAAAGLYGHALIDRYLRLVTGFPAPFSPAAPRMLETIGAVVGAALVVLAVPGFIAARAPARLALQE
ncbi:MAG: ABC transporter permease, partial [Actinomycetota bacterium]|nr:ABC transporter permease [Actinomycetota bacterium]